MSLLSWFRKQQVGQTGEQLAVRFLRKRGLRIVETNWRAERSEIDIIAIDKKSKRLHIIEVKSRTGECWGSVEASLTPQKIHALYRGGQAYVKANSFYNCELQFGLVVVFFLDKESQNHRIEYVEELRLADFI